MQHHIDLPEREDGDAAYLDVAPVLTGGNYFALRMSPDDMRRVAALLLQTADDAEGHGEATLVLSRTGA